MKLLLDENLPKKLKYHLPGHEVYHVVIKFGIVRKMAS